LFLGQAPIDMQIMGDGELRWNSSCILFIHHSVWSGDGWEEQSRVYALMRSKDLRETAFFCNSFPADGPFLSFLPANQARTGSMLVVGRSRHSHRSVAVHASVCFGAPRTFLGMLRGDMIRLGR
jgi:hypothetical protein